jgi:hypothetical protein
VHFRSRRLADVVSLAGGQHIVFGAFEQLTVNLHQFIMPAGAEVMHDCPLVARPAIGST